MIDLHCHILPGLDDGAQQLNDTLHMAKLAVSEGIHTMIATPHHKNGVYDNPKERILQSIEWVNKELENHRIPLKVLPGQEVRVYGEIMEDVEKGTIQTINHSSYVLVEFPSNHIPRYAKQVFFDLLQQGMQPILVHPERNSAIMENPNLLYEFVQSGVFSQVTAGSVTGKFGKKIKKLSHDLIEANLVHFLASDAHNTTNRAFWIQEALDEVAHQFGMDQIYVFEQNAQLAINDQMILVERPDRIKQKKFLGLFLR